MRKIIIMITIIMGICSGISTMWLFIHCFKIELEFGSVDFCGGRKTGEPGEKPSEQGENQQQTQPTYDAGSENQTWTHWWEASTLTTTPSLLPAEDVVSCGYLGL